MRIYIFLTRVRFLSRDKEYFILASAVAEVSVEFGRRNMSMSSVEVPLTAFSLSPKVSDKNGMDGRMAGRFPRVALLVCDHLSLFVSVRLIDTGQWQVFNQSPVTDFVLFVTRSCGSLSYVRLSSSLTSVPSVLYVSLSFVTFLLRL